MVGKMDDVSGRRDQGGELIEKGVRVETWS